MLKNFFRYFISSLFFLVVSSLSANAEFKAGFIYVGPVGDHGWSYQHHEGRNAVEAAGIKTTYVESVPEGADAERVIRQLASSGHGIIFTTSFGYMDPTNKVAKDFPNVKFEHATGYKREHPNVSTYSARFYEGRTILGTIAGTMTKTNTIGYIASFPIPEVIRGINSFTLAAQKVNPNIKTKIVWVFTWYDPGKEAEAAQALIDQGADVIAQHTDSTAAVQVAEKASIWAFGQASDMQKFAPNAVLTSIIDDWAPYYIQRSKAAKKGTWKQQDTWHGLKEGMVAMGDYNPAMGADLVKKVKQLQKDLASGKVHSFTGPIYDQKDNVLVSLGSVADDGMLAGMNVYVKGVEGEIPK
jgi:simple sugar transport system substrate-binding protein|tara:strand:+ start:4779 stop:5846 length:1068 start_codon:yes stop_codon:yes gene_type:complete